MDAWPENKMHGGSNQCSAYTCTVHAMISIITCHDGILLFIAPAPNVAPIVATINKL